MQIPSGFVIPLFLVSFVTQAFQYYRLDSDQRLFNVQFGMMLGAVVLTFADIFEPKWSLIYFVLGLCWLSLSIYLLRRVPPPRH